MLDTGPATIAADQHEVETRAKRLQIVAAFSEIVKGKRSDAIKGRGSCGVEKQWQEDEEHYDGIDDANRATARVLKGSTPYDSTREVQRDPSSRSTVFLRITRPYVDAASARVADMLLPTDDRNFAIRHEPKPELTRLVEGAYPVQPPQMPGMQPPAQPGGFRGFMGRMLGQQPEQAAMPMQPQEDPVVAQAKAILNKAKQSADQAQTCIDDYLTECRYHAEVRKMIESAAKVGTGILKGPVPVKVRKRAAMNDGGQWAVVMQEKIAPQSVWVNHWNFYPDPACGNDIQRGSYTFECDDITTRALTELKSDPSYLAEMIDACLQEGPTSPIDGTSRRKDGDTRLANEVFQIWYFYGQVSKKEMEAAGCKTGDKEMYPAIVTMVNDRVIKVSLSPLDSGEFPYDVMVWQARTDHWAGIGVARQMRECQRGANAAVRNLMDNAGLSAGPQIIVNRNLVTPVNGKWVLEPRKFWWAKPDADLQDVTKAFTVASIETRQVELMNILQFWLKEAEDVTGLPMLLQGQQGSAPDTVGGMQIMNNNGSTVLRRIARTFDDRVTEPHIGRYYEWLLLYGPDEAKGQFTVDARGSSALVEREMQAQQLVQMLGACLNPAYGLDPELVMREFLKSMRFDPKGLELSDEKKQAMANQPPPEDPRITAAKILAESKAAGDQAKTQMLGMELQQDSQEKALDRQLKAMQSQVDQQLTATGQSSAERQNLEGIKAQLAGIALKLNVQKDLAYGGAVMDLHKHRNPTPQVATPATEPPGRAPAGEAFQR